MRNLKPITSIDELLKHNVAYPEFTPVVFANRSLWQKLISFLAAAL